MNRAQLLIEPDELINRLEDPNLRLFDATVMLASESGDARDKYLAGHIPGAAFLDHAALSDGDRDIMYMLPDDEQLGAAIGGLGISNHHDVVVYSSDQIMWATRVWWILTYAGHQRVRVLNGGLPDWPSETESREHTYEPTTFDMTPQPGMFADKDDVMAAMGAPGVCTMNALPYSFYTGDTDVPYATAGHITGSTSTPFIDLMEGNRMKSDAEIAVQFANHPKSDRLITYCGGGIAATLNACAAKLAGIQEVAVYDGSLSEWLSEGLPTTKGDAPG